MEPTITITPQQKIVPIEEEINEKYRFGVIGISVVQIILSIVTVSVVVETAKDRDVNVAYSPWWGVTSLIPAFIGLYYGVSKSVRALVFYAVSNCIAAFVEALACIIAKAVINTWSSIVSNPLEIQMYCTQYRNKCHCEKGDSEMDITGVKCVDLHRLHEMIDDVLIYTGMCSLIAFVGCVFAIVLMCCVRKIRNRHRNTGMIIPPVPPGYIQQQSPYPGYNQQQPPIQGYNQQMPLQGYIQKPPLEYNQQPPGRD